jgi:hypothetical protein
MVEGALQSLSKYDMISGVFVFKIKKEKTSSLMMLKVLPEPYASYIENPTHMLLAISLSFAKLS